MKRFEACYQDAVTQIWEQYSIEAPDEAKARKEAERIAKMENKILILFKAVST
jgi:hypothetical protein